MKKYNVLVSNSILLLAYNIPTMQDSFIITNWQMKKYQFQYQDTKMDHEGIYYYRFSIDSLQKKSQDSQFYQEFIFSIIHNSAQRRTEYWVPALSQSQFAHFMDTSVSVRYRFQPKQKKISVSVSVLVKKNMVVSATDKIKKAFRSYTKLSISCRKIKDLKTSLSLWKNYNTCLATVC